jgi:hypothetical protein
MRESTELNADQEVWKRLVWPQLQSKIADPAQQRRLSVEEPAKQAEDPSQKNPPGPR